MSEGLEALKSLLEGYDKTEDIIYFVDKDKLDTIEQELKSLEIIKNKILDDKDYFELVARNCDLSKEEIEQVEGALYGI